MHIIQKQNKTTLAIGLVSVVALLLVGYLVFAYATKSVWPFAESTSPENNAASDGINYSGPTDQEIHDSQDAKKNNSHQDDGLSQDSDEEKRTVSVGIAFAGFDPEENAIDIRAFTPDTIEGDGTCTATLAQGSATVSQSSKAFIDYSSSQCEPILIPKSRFASGGTWSLVVTYESTSSTGISPSTDVEVEQ